MTASDDAAESGDEPADEPADDEGPAPEGAAPNTAPTANLTADRLTGEAPLFVQFSATGTDEDGDMLAWTATLDNGTQLAAGDSMADGVAFNHTFDAVGSFVVTLEVTDGAATAVANLTVVTVEPVPEGPTWDVSGSWLVGGYGCALISTSPESTNEGITHVSLTGMPAEAADKDYTVEFTGVAPEAFYVFRFYSESNENLGQTFGDPGVASFSGTVPEGASWMAFTGCGVDGATVSVYIA